LRETELSNHYSATIVAADDPSSMTLDVSGPPPAAFPAHPIVREPSISPYEPLRISAQESDVQVSEFDLPIMVEPAVDSQVLQIDDVQTLIDSSEIDPGASTTQVPAAAASAACAAAPPRARTAPVPPAAPSAPSANTSNSGRYSRPRESATAPRTDISGRFSRVKPPELKPAPEKHQELQKIIAVRVCAVAETAWDGTDLATAFAGSDLVHGRYGVFHRLHSDGRSIFCVASLVEPGSFDPASMPEQQFPGISIFAVLPGPVEPVQTFEELMATARQLAQDLSGMMQDEKGGPLSPQRAGSLREDVLRFQQRLQADTAN
jgi:cell division protein ZipA